MRSRLAALMLLAVLPLMSVLAAPVPNPSAVLDLGPPPKGEMAEHYRKRWMEAQTHRIALGDWMSDPEMKKLPAVARFDDPRPWLGRNLRVTAEDERRLRFTFRAGTHADQVVILNALLRVNIASAEEGIKCDERYIRFCEKRIGEIEERIKSIGDAKEIEILQKGIHKIRNIEIADCRADIALLKEFKVIKWAK